MTSIKVLTRNKNDKREILSAVALVGLVASNKPNKQTQKKTKKDTQDMFTFKVKKRRVREMCARFNVPS